MFSDIQLRLIRSEICAECTEAEIALFLQTCERSGLDPFARQLFPVMRFNRDKGRKVMSIQVSIDGFRSIAESTGEYAGQTMPEWCGSDGVWRDVWLSDDYPTAARIGVWRKGFNAPVYRVALWKEYVQTYNNGNVSSMWTEHATIMLLKCAESQALRAAFPQKLSGLFTEDEMSKVTESEPEDSPKKPVDNSWQERAKGFKKAVESATTIDQIKAAYGTIESYCALDQTRESWANVLMATNKKRINDDVLAVVSESLMKAKSIAEIEEIYNSVKIPEIMGIVDKLFTEATERIIASTVEESEYLEPAELDF